MAAHIFIHMLRVLDKSLHWVRFVWKLEKKILYCYKSLYFGYKLYSLAVLSTTNFGHHVLQGHSESKGHSWPACNTIHQNENSFNTREFILLTTCCQNHYTVDWPVNTLTFWRCFHSVCGLWHWVRIRKRTNSWNFRDRNCIFNFVFPGLYIKLYRGLLIQCI